MFPPFPVLKDDWRATLARNERAVVFFFAAWSINDRLLAVALERVAPEFAEQCAFLAADLDDENVQGLLDEAHVMTCPQLIYFRQGQVRGRTLSLLNDAALRQWLRDWLAVGS